MSRIRTLFSIVVPSMIAGGVIFGSAFGHASAGRDDVLGFWPAANDVTSPGTANQGSAAKAPRPPRPPQPPGHHGGHGGGFSVSIHDGKVEVDGIKDMVLEQLDSVRDSLRDNPGIPNDVRGKVLERLGKVRLAVGNRLSNLKTTDMSKFGDEMEKMGDEIEKAMDGLDQDLSKLGDKMGKDFGRKFGKDFGRQFGKDFSRQFRNGNHNFNVHIDADTDADADVDVDDVDPPEPPDVDLDDADAADFKNAIAGLKDIALTPAQRDAIGRLRADSDKQVAAAKKALDDLSNRLHTALDNAATSDADIGRYVDQISAQEAAIRKARLLAWVNARRVLDDAQRRRIEDAAKKKTK
jgi:hypothetical protein